MQTRKNGVRAHCPEDGNVASIPRRNVLDHYSIETTIRIIIVGACFPGEGRTVRVSLPQSLSIKSRAASKSCSENRVLSFSTASSETMFCGGYRGGDDDERVNVSDHVGRGKREKGTARFPGSMVSSIAWSML